MGFLADVGQTLNYYESKPFLEYIKQHGIIQFLLLLKKFGPEKHDTVFWGDEIEFHLLHCDPSFKFPKLQPNTEYMFSAPTPANFSLQVEFGAWMIELVPTLPYGCTGDPLPVLENMKERRLTIRNMCKEHDVLFAGTVYPMMGVSDYFVPRAKEEEPADDEDEEDDSDPCFNDTNPASKSQFVHDEIINPHPRFSTMAENIRLRRGEKVCIKVPIFQDEKTSHEPTKDEPYPGYIYMDAQHFGMGSGCLQLTYGTRDVEQARYLVDQMAVFSSIMLPLSAASVIFKGKLADTDVRWDAIAASVDCRNPEERDPNNAKYIPKSRYDSISLYISNSPLCKDEYNDLKFPLNEEIMKFAAEQAKSLGVEVDDRLLNHLGFLFLRDPMIIFSDRIYVDDSLNTNHFENIQSMNWNSVRFKPPPSFNSSVGWRVELRTPEGQLTADENTAYTMFAYFVAQMIMKKELNFYIPMSKVDENMRRGHKRDAILKEKFWFRKDVSKNSADEYVELTLDEILHGKADTFVGLLPLIYDFCKEEFGVDMLEEAKKIKEGGDQEPHKIAENVRLFNILSKRARGESPTVAAWIRSFVQKHPKYAKDSIITDEIATDLINAMNAISDYEKTYEDFV